MPTNLRRYSFPPSLDVRILRTFCASASPLRSLSKASTWTAMPSCFSQRRFPPWPGTQIPTAHLFFTFSIPSSPITLHTVALLKDKQLQIKIGDVRVANDRSSLQCTLKVLGKVAGIADFTAHLVVGRGMISTLRLIVRPGTSPMLALINLSLHFRVSLPPTSPIVLEYRHQLF